MNRQNAYSALIISLLVLLTVSTGSVIAIDNDATSQGLDNDDNDDSTYEWLAEENNPNSDYARVDNYQEVREQLERNPQYLFSGGISSELTENLQKTSEKLEQRVGEFEELEDTGSIYEEIEALNSELYIYREVEGGDDVRVSRFTTEEGQTTFDTDNISFEENEDNLIFVQYDDGDFSKEIDTRYPESEYSSGEYYAEEPETSIPESDVREIEELLDEANSQGSSTRLGTTGDRSYSDEPHSDVQVWNSETITGLDSYGGTLSSETDTYSGGSLVPEHRVGDVQEFPENCESDSCAVTGIHASIASFTSTWVHLERQRNSPLTEDDVTSETVVYREEVDEEDDVRYTFSEEIPFEKSNLRREPYSRQFDSVIYSGDEEYLIDRIPRNGEYTVDSYYSETRTQTPSGTDETNEDLDDVSTRLAPDEGQMTIMYDSSLQKTPEESIPDDVKTGDTRTLYENTSIELTDYEVTLQSAEEDYTPCENIDCSLNIEEEHKGDRSLVLTWDLTDDEITREKLRNHKMEFKLTADYEHTTTRVVDEATVICEEFEDPESPSGGDTEPLECIDESTTWEEISRTDVTLNTTTVEDTKSFEFSQYELVGAGKYADVQEATYVGQNRKEYSVELNNDLGTSDRPVTNDPYYEPWDTISVGNETLKSQWSYFSSRNKYWDQLVEVTKDSDSERDDLEDIYQDESDRVFSSSYRPLTTHAYPEYGIYNASKSSARMTQISKLDTEQRLIYSPAMMVHESCRQNWPYAEENGVQNSEPCYWEFTSSGDQIYPPEFTEFVHEEITVNNYANYIETEDNYYTLFKATPGDGDLKRWIYRNTVIDDSDNREPAIYTGSYIQAGGAVFEVTDQEETTPQLSPITSDEQQELTIDSTTNVYETRVRMEEIDQCGMLMNSTGIPKVDVDCMSSDSVEFISNYTQQFVAYKVRLEGLPLTEDEREEIKDDPDRSLEDEWVPISTEERDESLIVQGGIELNGVDFQEDKSQYEIFVQDTGNVSNAYDRKSRYSTDSDGEAIILVENSRWDTPEYSVTYDSTHWKNVSDGRNAYQSTRTQGTIPSKSRSYAFEQLLLELSGVLIVIYLILTVHDLLLYQTSFHIDWAEGIEDQVPWWIFASVFAAAIILSIRYPPVRDEVFLLAIIFYATKYRYDRNLNRTQ